MIVNEGHIQRRAEDCPLYLDKRVTPCALSYFLRSDNEMDHAIRRGDEETIEILA